jgi:Putative transposase
LLRYQLHLVERGISPISLNATLTGLKFLFETTLNHPELLTKMHAVHVPYKLPVVLSREGVARLLAATDNLKHQAALSVVTVPACVSARWCRWRSATLIASAWRCALNRAKCAKVAGQLQFFGDYAHLADASAFADWLAPLKKCEWVVYAKRPFAVPSAVLAYLSRYTHRVAIANSRLISLDEQDVTFRW